MLAVLEALDRHSFDRVDSGNNLDVLYNKVFGPSTGCGNTPNQNGKDNIQETKDPVNFELLKSALVTNIHYGLCVLLLLGMGV